MELNGLWPELIMPALIQVNEQSPIPSGR